MNYLLKTVAAITLSVVVLGAPAGALAAVFANTELIEVGEPIADDAFLAGERVVVRETIQDDAFIAGGILEIANTIGEDLFAAGNTITVSSEIQDDVFAAGDMLTFEGASMGDLFAAGRFIELRGDTRVSGDAYMAGARIVINGTIAGDVRAASDLVEVGPDATIQGDLIVYSAKAPQVDAAATIAGSVRHVTEAAVDRTANRSLIGNWVRSVLTLFIVSLVAMYLLPKLARIVVDTAPTQTLSSFLVGLVWLFLTLPVVVILCLTIVGWPLGLALGSLSLLVIFLGICLVPLVVGAWIHRRWIKKSPDAPLQWQHALLGAVVVVTLHWVPLVGPLLMAVLLFTVAGSLLRTFRQYV